MVNRGEVGVKRKIGGGREIQVCQCLPGRAERCPSVRLRPTVDKSSTTAPAILSHTVKLFITSLGRKAQFFKKVSHNYPHTHPAQ